ncbi:hypothetical protein Daesc_006444 [Daldinia eschscholtzii]|uniref:Uncharacterized protein n=1 Tax=Daldinia eschscholtzii TaxID=292717 RepID=A0AAX6MH20_9PEZI
MAPITFSVELDAVFFFALYPIKNDDDTHLAPVTDLSPLNHPGITSPTYQHLRNMKTEMSPVMYATERGFFEVGFVSNRLRATFRAAVPTSCGMRVYVGTGNGLFPLSAMKRIASICWASDRVLQQMHPVSRHYNNWCKGPRIMTRLAEGEETEQSDGDTMVRQDIPLQEYINKTQPKRLSTKFDRAFSRHTLNGILSEAEQHVSPFICEIHDEDQSLKPVKGPNILKGAIRLFECCDYDAVAKFMDTNLHDAYKFFYYPSAHWKEEYPRPIIEFSMAAGSLDGHWISTYAKICTSIVRFATGAAEEDIWRMIYDCHVANTDNTRYDIFDLLLDLGLAKEAETVQRRAERSDYKETLQQYVTIEDLRKGGKDRVYGDRTMGLWGMR